MADKPTNTEIIREILKQKPLYSSPLLTARIKKAESVGFRSLFIVPTSVSKKAVDRNRLKRRARDIVRGGLKEKSGVMVAVFFKKGAEKLNFTELKSELLKAILKIN